MLRLSEQTRHFKSQNSNFTTISVDEFFDLIYTGFSILLTIITLLFLHSGWRPNRAHEKRVINGKNVNSLFKSILPPSTSLIYKVCFVDHNKRQVIHSAVNTFTTISVLAQSVGVFFSHIILEGKIKKRRVSTTSFRTVE